MTAGRYIKENVFYKTKYEAIIKSFNNDISIYRQNVNERILFPPAFNLFLFFFCFLVYQNKIRQSAVSPAEINI